jgi:hypothetical protein
MFERRLEEKERGVKEIDRGLEEVKLKYLRGGKEERR